MGNKARRMRGFTLIASLLVLVLLSGVAIGLMFLVNSQQHIGSNDLEDNLAYYGAESGMEKMTSDLAALYSTIQAPTQADINGVAAAVNWPTAAEVGPMIYNETIARQLDTNGNPIQNATTISSGPEQGLSALTIPINMQVSATRPGSNASVNMFRTVEVALIPVFQFGVFCSGDCSYFAGPHFGFQGRLHTNGNLFLAANTGPLIIDGKVTAFGEIIRDRLANGWNSGGYNGSVYLPSQTGGCTAYLPAAAGNPPNGSNCLDLGPDINNAANDASWTGGIPPAGAPNADPTYAAWITAAKTFNGFITNRINGAKLLQLPFVQSNNPALGSSAQQILIIRKGMGAADTAAIANSKLYNKAAIRILLADTQALLHPDRPGVLAGDVDLTNSSDANGYQIALTGGGYTRVAMAHTGAFDPAWTAAPSLVPPLTVPDQPIAVSNNWNLINGWIRVEYLNTANPPVWTPITIEWLKYGFARGTAIPVAPGTNTVHPNAILILQEQKPGAPNPFDAGVGLPSPSAVNSGSKYSFYPINFWDPREGLARDNAGALTGTQCNANGIMNAVELDVGNLNQWLQGLGNYAAGSGLQVNSTLQNGYVLYFSDRRGMEQDLNVAPNAVNGEYGFEDVVNSAAGAAVGTPDGVLEPVTPGYNLDRNNNVSYSPEDVDENGVIDKWGAVNVGNGFQFPAFSTTAVNTNTVPPNPYQPVDCLNGGMQNIVTGARHVLKLVDGSLGNVPMARPPQVPAVSGGFTVASENPVYVQGDYNSNAADTVWNLPAVDSATPHAAAAIIADAVSVLSNSWTDLNDMQNPLNLGGRVPLPTYYRVAIAAGKNMNFPQLGPGADFGTDGGVHNFLRLLENWGGVGLFYRGSMVSLYYSQYATGTFKCCTEVYGAPTRNFSFDTDFRNPNNLPPGTPMLQDINNLSERQDFTPQ
jgi:Tfp pilus assembly protein PilX